MALRPRDRLVYIVERLMVRGAQWRLLVIAIGVAVISIVGAALVVAGDGRFDSFADAVWWAFLRLSDPGYLGDDIGTWRRIVSTVLTVAGYVVFLGALIAVMTQWLNALMRRLQLGITPIIKQGHVLILGWTERTPTIVRDLMKSKGRVKRFLARHDARSLDIVILTDEVDERLVQELRDQLGADYDGHRIVLRSGTPLRVAHLDRVDFLRASVIVVPGSDFPAQVDRETAGLGLTISDTMAIKVLLSIENQAASRSLDVMPQIVAEVMDARKVPVAENAYSGPLEVVASDLIISRLIAQNVRHPGVSHVANELLAQSRGNEIHARELAGAVGCTLAELVPRFPRAILIGVVRPDGRRFRPLLAGPRTLQVEPGDRLVLVARDYADTELAALDGTPPVPAPAPPSAAHAERASVSRRVLVLGWSNRVPLLMGELAAYTRDRFDVDIASAFPVSERTRQLARYQSSTSLQIHHFEHDFTVPTELAAIAPESYDNVVLLGSSWLESREASDARTVLGYLLLRDLVTKHSGPETLIELLDASNLSLFREQPGEVLISPEIVSHMLAQVALRPELGSVFDELFGPAGAEIHFEPARDFDLVGQRLTFDAARIAVENRGGVALGVRRGADKRAPHGGVHLNPPDDSVWTFAADDDLIVLFND